MEAFQKIEEELERCKEEVEMQQGAAAEAKKEIEEQFARCVDALKERKKNLLMDVDQKALHHMKEARISLEDSVKRCKRLLADPVTDMGISESIMEIRRVQIPQLSFTTSFSASLLHDISNSGLVQVATPTVLTTTNINSTRNRQNFRTLQNSEVFEDFENSPTELDPNFENSENGYDEITSLWGARMEPDGSLEIGVEYRNGGKGYVPSIELRRYRPKLLLHFYETRLKFFTSSPSDSHA